MGKLSKGRKLDGALQSIYLRMQVCTSQSKGLFFIMPGTVGTCCADDIAVLVRDMASERARANVSASGERTSRKAQVGFWRGLDRLKAGFIRSVETSHLFLSFKVGNERRFP